MDIWLIIMLCISVPLNLYVFISGMCRDDAIGTFLGMLGLTLNVVTIL